jgi:Protein of unknown function (DUF3379)
MTHDEARELIGTDPDTASAELLAHLHTCPECKAHRQEMLALNAKLRRALELDWQKVHKVAPPTGPPTALRPAAPPLPADRPDATADTATLAVLNLKAPSAVAKHPRPRLFALAASVAAALVMGATLWLSRPTSSLAGEIIAHVEGEPNSWQQTELVPAEKLDGVLRKSGVKLGRGMEPVVYASSCWFRGHFVPHVVVTTKHGPVTVMILLHEQVAAAQRFNDGGYSGLLVPASTGSVAVLSRTPMVLDEPAAAVMHALQSAQ